MDPNGFSGLGKLTTLTLIFDYAMELYYEMHSHYCNSVCKQVELPPSLLHCYGTTTTHCLHLNFLLNNTFLTIKIHYCFLKSMRYPTKRTFSLKTFKLLLWRHIKFSDEKSINELYEIDFL